MEQAWENVYITQTFPSSPATDENLKWIGNEELYNHMNWKQGDVTSHRMDPRLVCVWWILNFIKVCLAKNLSSSQCTEAMTQFGTKMIFGDQTVIISKGCYY